MNGVLKSTVTILALALASVTYPPSSSAADPPPDPCACPAGKFLSAPPDIATDIANPVSPHFTERARAMIVFQACEALSMPTPDPATLNHHSFGEGFDVRLLGLLAYP